MNKLKSFIKNGNNCDKCKCFQSKKTSYEYEEYDCFCIIKGDCDKKCFLVEPFKSILYFFKKRKYNYYSNHQYDNISEWYTNNKKEEKEFIDLVNRILFEEEDTICYRNSYDFNYYPYSSDYINEQFLKLKYEYDDMIKETISLRTKWKNLIKETKSYFYRKTIGKIIPYIKK